MPDRILYENDIPLEGGRGNCSALEISKADHEHHNTLFFPHKDFPTMQENVHLITPTNDVNSLNCLLIQIKVSRNA